MQKRSDSNTIDPKPALMQKQQKQETHKQALPTKSAEHEECNKGSTRMTKEKVTFCLQKWGKGLKSLPSGSH